MTIQVFNEDDVRVLQGLIDREKQRTINAPPTLITDRFDQGEDHQAPEVYVAYPLTSYGIPAMSGNEPGEAECAIYSIRGVPAVLEEVEDLVQTVYNLSATSLAQEYLLIHRDKFGKWVAGTGGGGGSVGNEWIDFTVYQICPSLPNGAIQAVYAQVTRTSCVTSVTIGDIVLVYDTNNCWFNVPIELLATLSGRADLTAGNNEQVLFCAEYRSLGACYWKVTSLCCYEEPY